jgi:hypothetical protein
MAIQYTGNPLATLTNPNITLAPPSEFVLVEGSPHGTKARMGTAWLGLNGTVGTVLKASAKLMGDISETADGASGTRAMFSKKNGVELELEMQHDRSFPSVKKLDRFRAWCDIGHDVPTLLTFIVSEVSADKGDDETASIKMTAMYKPGFSTATSMYRAVVDEFGRVVSFDDATKFAAGNTQPGVLPTDPPALSGTVPGGNTNPGINI